MRRRRRRPGKKKVVEKNEIFAADYCDYIDEARGYLVSILKLNGRVERTRSKHWPIFFSSPESEKWPNKQAASPSRFLAPLLLAFFPSSGGVHAAVVAVVVVVVLSKKCARRPHSPGGARLTRVQRNKPPAPMGVCEKRRRGREKLAAALNLTPPPRCCGWCLRAALYKIVNKIYKLRGPAVELFEITDRLFLALPHSVAVPGRRRGAKIAAHFKISS